MPDICKCYRTRERKEPRYGVMTGRYMYSERVTVGYCTGTKNQEDCNCGGDISKCDFYPKLRGVQEAHE